MAISSLIATGVAGSFFILRYAYKRFISKSINLPDKYMDFLKMC